MARQALGTLAEALAMEKTRIVRDASIQRFEYTFEAVWKAAQSFVKQHEGVEAASPKAVVRAYLQRATGRGDLCQVARACPADEGLAGGDRTAPVSVHR
jgi:hypothetical protein